jgi:hypothetical protein
MDIKRVAIGIMVGWISMHLVGFLIFQVMLVDFALANRGSATDAFREPVVYWGYLFGDLVFAILLTFAICVRNAQTIAAGFVTGAVVGFLVWFGVQLITYGYANIWTLTAVIVLPLFAGFAWGIAGAAVAAVLARVPKSENTNTKRPSTNLQWLDPRSDGDGLTDKRRRGRISRASFPMFAHIAIAPA